MKTKGRISQNGVKYRTLCHRCNNNFLGTRYDPPFISFVNSIGQHLKSSLHLQELVHVRGQPQAILRALLGHISAQGVDRYKKGPLTEAVRDYFLDTTLPLPRDIRVFYWAYAHCPHVMFRDAGYLDIPTGNTFAMWLLKFFPVAFMIIWGNPGEHQYPMESFEHWRDSPFELEVEMPLRLRATPPQYWPEAPTDRSVVLYGQEAIHARV